MEPSGRIDIPIKLHKGEESVICIAKNSGIKSVLIDEISTRTAAKLLDLEPGGTIFVLLKSLKMKIIDFDEFLDILNQLIVEGFRLREEIYINAVKEARKIEKEK